MWLGERKDARAKQGEAAAPPPEVPPEVPTV
jgi:hypothetical protein